MSEDELPKRNLKLEELEEFIAYRFRDRELLMRALTHSSFANEQEDYTRDNERLEFLGDAVLGLAVSDVLFNANSGDEGALTRAKSHLVSARYIGRLAKRMQMGEFLLLGHGEEKDGGRSKKSILANVFEAVIAAVYLDGGMEAAQRFVVRAYGDELEKIDKDGLLRNDYKSFLQELIQGRELPAPVYTLVESSGPDHSKSFAVEVRIGESGPAIAGGSGRSKKIAEQEAARAALALIDEGAIDLESLEKAPENKDRS
jgi:ribonuclease-3